MPAMKIATALTQADWSKKVGALDKPSGIGELLKALNKQHDAVPFELLDTAGLKDADAVKARVGEVEGKFAKAAKTLGDQAKAVAVAAKKCEADFKKDGKAPKTAAPAAAAVAQAAGELARGLVDDLATTLTELKAMLGKLEAQDKKDQQAAADKAKKEEAKNAKDEDEDNAEDLANHKDEKKFRDKVKATLVGWLKRVKAEGAPPAKFTVAVLGRSWGVYLGKSAGEAEKKIAMRLAGVTSGFKHCKGVMFWDPQGKVWVFEGPNIPIGRANATAMSLALKPIIGYAPRLRLQKPGERGEDSEGGEPDPEEAQLAAAPTGGGAVGPAGVDPKKAFAARLGALLPKVKLILAEPGSDADRIRTAVARAGELAGRGNAAQANALLDQVEKQLEPLVKALEEAKAKEETDAEAAQGTEEGGGAGTPAKAAPPTTARIDKALVDAWATVRSDALRGIDQLAKRIEQEYRDEHDQRKQVQDAVGRLRALAGQLKADLETQLAQAIKEADANRRAALLRTAKTTLTGVLRTVAQDPLMKELDGNELMPELKIVKPMQERLREIATALN